MDKRASYQDAMVYASMLYRMKSAAECTAQAYAHDNALAETLWKQSRETTTAAAEPAQEEHLGEDEVPFYVPLPPPPPPPPPPGGRRPAGGVVGGVIQGPPKR